MKYEPVSFADLPDWALDDHAAALRAFKLSIDVLGAAYPSVESHVEAAATSQAARSYFETNFQPHHVVHTEQPGFFTGYFEPVLNGSRSQSDRFSVPLLRRPHDLATIVDDSLRATAQGTLTHARKTTHGLEPFPDREAIEQGCLASDNLEICFLEDHIDAYFLHVQGSGIVALENGDRIRVSYAAKNGHPYTSVGKLLIEQGTMTPKQMSLQSLQDWLNAQPDGGRSMLWQNKSYIFFEELGPADAVAAEGAKNIALTAERSLAVDASYHALGLPIFIDVARPHGATDANFRRLMVAQDVGSAIVGPERADIFFGTGKEAGMMAGTTKHPGNMYVLLPRQQT